MLPDAFFEPAEDDVYVSTAATSGPWSPDAQHAGPPSALLAHVIENAAGIETGQLARIALDILRPVPVAPLRATASVVRGGKRIELLEATLSTLDGTDVMRACAWRLRAEAVADLGWPTEAEPPPVGPDGCAEQGRPTFWKGEVAYWDALEWRAVHGGIEIPGPGAVWTRLRIPLVAGRETRPVEHMLVMCDAASGISSVLDWTRFIFSNVDLSAAFDRPPAGEWLAMDCVTRPGPLGAGVASADLFDASGRVGSSTQALLIAPQA